MVVDILGIDKSMAVPVAQSVGADGGALVLGMAECKDREGCGYLIRYQR